MGLSPEEFWRLTWWDWGMEVLKLFKRQKKLIDDREFVMSIERIKIADFRNANFRKENGEPLKLEPCDVFHLSYDKPIEETTERPMTFKEAKALFGSKIKKG